MLTERPVSRAIKARRPWLWRCLGLLFLAVNLLALGEIVFAYFEDPIQKTDFGDFAAYYIGGAILNSDRPHLYDRAVERATVEAIGFNYRYTPYIYPPFLAVAFRAVAWTVPFMVARAIWTVLNLTMLLHATMLLVNDVTGSRRWRDYLLAFLLALAFPPVYINIFITGQINVLLLYLLTLAYHFNRPGCAQNRPILAGLALGLATGVKLFPGPLIAHVWLRRSRPAAYVAAAVVLLTLAVGAWGGAGWPRTWFYFQQEVPRLNGVEDLFWFNNSRYALRVKEPM